MKVITYYQCEICGQLYESSDQAVFCEEHKAQFVGAIPGIGDRVLISEGQGLGSLAEVVSTHVTPCLDSASRVQWHAIRLDVCFAWQGHIARRVLHGGQYEIPTW